MAYGRVFHSVAHAACVVHANTLFVEGIEMKKERRWELIEDGYNKISRYVQMPSGLIIGHVEGCNYGSKRPWEAFVEGANNLLRHVGDYTTEAKAKEAVENSQSQRKAATEKEK
jgi:hypothetical protein